MHQHTGQDTTTRSDVWRALCRASDHPVSPAVLDGLRTNARAELDDELRAAHAQVVGTAVTWHSDAETPLGVMELRRGQP